MQLARNSTARAAASKQSVGSTKVAVLPHLPKGNHARLQVAGKVAAVEVPKDELSDALLPKMLCYQCEQTHNHEGCVTVGNCGKTPEVAGLQDLLIFSLKGLGCLAHHARQHGVTIPEVDTFMLKAVFSTLTNVNFDDARFEVFILDSIQYHKQLLDALAKKKVAAPAVPDARTVFWFEPATGHPLTWNAQMGARLAKGDAPHLTEMLRMYKATGIVGRQRILGKTVAGLQELIVYGLKGLCAYAAHAEALGGTKDEVYAAVHKHLTFLCSPGAEDVGKLLEEALAVGATNLIVMELLSTTHSNTFGHPTPTEVSTVPVPGKCILVTGHDMHDMHELLEQTKGLGINVYTHGEMLPAHGYPGLHKYPHLKGHFGGAWYRQKVDFASWPGAILVTTNCVLDPLTSYRSNMFTTNETGVSNVHHIGTKDFSAVIKRAQELPGWSEKNIGHVKTGGLHKASVTVGFGHNAVLAHADKVLGAVKDGKLKHIFLVGGCDGNEPQRAYYGKLGQHLPQDTMLLTLGCGKFRILDQEFGTLADTGLPRLLDMGQCNDAYSALVVAQELAKALNTDINSLPLSLDLSWFEQKAVAVLLTLLNLGVKDIRLGPALPAFLTKEAVNVLVDMYNLRPASVQDPEGDLQRMMMEKA